MSADATAVVGEAAGVGRRVRRLVEATLFEGVWLALGLLLQLDGARYQLVGAPLAVAFQLLVRRRPVREQLVRDGPAFRLDARGVLIGAALLALGYPAYLAVTAGPVEGWLVGLWMAAYAVGALAAAYALHHLRADGRAWLLAASAAGIGLVLVVLTAILDRPTAAQPPVASVMLAAGLQAAALYFPIAFVLEEVQFRGLVDAHVHRPGEPYGWLSALFVSALWGSGTCRTSSAAARSPPSSPSC